ncbi:DUF29 domain-containing protein [Pleurocapsa sp. PCC 7319]|uniref:DUF29 domain-containing protein n=1 Tax=Pleurocapsa sp. PCC 7319 TaxID=118161 RepID=UPI00034529BA|nr:DUF29 domain-containing protein [Pleurocapsa sp. PCC 7319]
MNNDYNSDYVTWLEIQSELLRKGDYDNVDLDHLIKHLEYLAREEKEKLRYLAYKIIVNLLLIDYWKIQKQSIPYWLGEVDDYQFQLNEKLTVNHKILLNIVVDEIYLMSKRTASRISGMEQEHFPQICPYTLDDILHK